VAEQPEVKGTGPSMKGTGFSPYISSAPIEGASAPEGNALTPAPRARVLAMKEYHPPLGSRDELRLDFNENTLACSPRVREVLGQISAGSLTRYPEREPVEAIVAAHLGLKPEQVALTNGVDEAIHVLFQAFLEADDELLLPVPTYTMYEIYSSATDARAVTVLAGDDLAFPYERLTAAITPQTKIIAVANPNSPSGTVATREQLLELARCAPHAILLVDEAYYHFHGETVMDLVGTVPNLVVARTFSKAYGLAGLRLGLLAGPVELMRWVRRVLSPYSVNSLALACLPPALEDQAYVDWYVGEVLAARDEFEAALDALNVRRWPSRANFVLADIGAQHAEFVRRMKAAGVLVRDRSSDPGCDGRVRITIGTREQMQSAIAALSEAMATLRKPVG
jgi:histidinol-phosphate aminotransferase